MNTSLSIQLMFLSSQRQTTSNLSKMLSVFWWMW